MWGFAIIPFLLIISLFGVIIPVAIGVFVYKDAEQRGMNGLMWALIVIFIPSFIGLIIYFIVRESESAYECKNCGASVKGNQDFCPNCGANLQNRYDLDGSNSSHNEGRIKRERSGGSFSPLIIIFIVLAVGAMMIFVLLGISVMRNSISNDFMMQIFSFVN